MTKRLALLAALALAPAWSRAAMINPTPHDDSPKVYAEIVAELEALKEPHPWAGFYHGPSGLSFSYLTIAPSRRFCSSTFYDGGGVTVSRCGRLRLDGDRFLFDGPPPAWAQDDPDAPPYRLVSWGTRRYLVPESRWTKFADAVNSGSEPRLPDHGGSPWALLRPGEEARLVAGTPEPSTGMPFLYLDRPLFATAVAVSSRAQTIRRFEDFELKDCSAPARFDVGLSSGAFVGLTLHALAGDPFASAVLSRVAERESEGLIQQDDCDRGPIPVGTRFSTRESWHLRLELSTTPATAEVRFESPRRYSPLGFDAPFDISPDSAAPREAAAAGFDLKPIGVVTMRYPFAAAESLASARAILERSVLSMGANAYEAADPAASPKDSDDAPRTVRYRTFRLSYRGTVLPSDRVYWLSFEGWKALTPLAESALCATQSAGAAARRARGLELLGWDDALLSRAGRLRFEDLTPDQLARLDAFVPKDRREGLVWPALVDRPADKLSPFEAEIFHAGGRAEFEFEKAHPTEAAECERLQKEAWDRHIKLRKR